MGEPLADLVGAEHVARPEGERLDGVPVDTVVRPGDAAEVAACLASAREHGRAVVVRGGGSKLGFGNPPAAPSLVLLDTRRLTAPVEVQPEEGIATFGAGVGLDEVESACAARGMVTALGARAGATVGGTIAADAPAPLQAEQRLRNDVLGLEVALANGNVTRCGGRVVKNVTGFDLVRLYGGSCGTLGVITEATLRVHPRPALSLVRTRSCASWDEAQALASELSDSRAEPAGLAAIPEGEGVRVLWRLDGDEADAQARAERCPGQEAAASAWHDVQARVIGEGAGPVALRIGARPSDTIALCRAVIEAGAEPRVALPLAGLVLARADSAGLETLFARCEREGWALWIDRAPVADKESTLR